MLLATQFEAPHAREAFPCVDEPEAKATFQLSLVSPKHWVVLSNTAVESQKVISKTQNAKTTFGVTPKNVHLSARFCYGGNALLRGKDKSRCCSA